MHRPGNTAVIGAALLTFLFGTACAPAWKQALEDRQFRDALAAFPVDGDPAVRRTIELGVLRKAAYNLPHLAACLDRPEAVDQACVGQYYAERDKLAAAEAMVDSSRVAAGLPPVKYDDSAFAESRSVYDRLSTPPAPAKHDAAFLQRGLELLKAQTVTADATLGDVLSPYWACKGLLAVKTAATHPFADAVKERCDALAKVLPDQLHATVSAANRGPYARAAHLQALLMLGDKTVTTEMYESALAAAETFYELPRLELVVSGPGCTPELERFWKEQTPGLKTDRPPRKVTVVIDGCSVAHGTSSENRTNVTSWTEERWVEERVVTGYTLGKGSCTSWESNSYGGKSGTMTVTTHTYCGTAQIPVYDTKLVKKVVPVSVSRDVTVDWNVFQFRIAGSASVDTHTGKISIPGRYADGKFQVSAVRGRRSPKDELAEAQSSAWRYMSGTLLRDVEQIARRAHAREVIEALEAKGDRWALEEAAILRQLTSTSRDYGKELGLTGLAASARRRGTVLDRENGELPRASDVGWLGR